MLSWQRVTGLYRFSVSCQGCVPRRSGRYGLHSRARATGSVAGVPEQVLEVGGFGTCSEAGRYLQGRLEPGYLEQGEVPGVGACQSCNVPSAMEVRSILAAHVT